MREPSILESKNTTRMQQHSGIAFGRITAVDTVKRLCAVNTFAGEGPMADSNIPACQWINGDATPEGDESGSIPSKGSLGLVFYVQGQPFIFGFWRPTKEDGSANTGPDLEPLNQNDRIMKTAAGNKIIVYRNGIIEIFASDTCYRYYFPDQGLINELCQNYEFRTDGGTIDWHSDDDGNTRFVKEYRDDINRANIVLEERGTVDGTVISRTTITVGSDLDLSQAVYTRTIQTDGTTQTFVRKPGAAGGYKSTISPDGTTVVDIADGTTQLTIAPDGTVNLTTKGKATIKADKIDLDGGGALQPVHTFPNAISDFSGLPINTPSQTVQAST